MSNLLKNFKIGLVLAGGGAKGAYEAGVFKTLWELELIDNIKVISGTSIGSVNALLLAMENKKIIRDSWNNLSYSRFINFQEKTRNISATQFVDKLKNINKPSGIIEQVRNNDLGILSQDGVKKFIEEYIDFKVIKESPKDIFACAYNIDKGKAEYFKLKDYNEREMLDIVLASCAIPFMFLPINIRGSRYADGGIASPEYPNSNVDNVPLTPLIDYDCDLIIVVHLSRKKTINRSKFNGKNILEIYPSNSLELINGTGGLMLHSNTLKQNIEMGYRDSMVLLAPIVINLLKGKSIKI